MSEIASQTSLNQADSGKLQVAYVRHELEPNLLPPVSERGVIGWMHKNLFDGLYNTLLTLIGLYLLYLVVPGVIKFNFIDAVWSGENRRACATIAQGGIQPDGWSGACWPYIGAYFKQFIYGRYPDMELWRPNIVYGVFAAGLVPLLIPSAPFKTINLLFMLGAFPLIAFILLSGGNLDFSGFLLPEAMMTPSTAKFLSLIHI